MAYNDKPCDSCEHFDPVLKGVHTGGHKETSWGWCTKRSKYPAKEGPGQVFPAGVVRVAEGERAEPYIVKKGHVEGRCQMYQIKKAQLNKADLLLKAQKK